MRVLAIDTSSAVSVVSLVSEGDLLGSDAQGTEQRHAETLLPRIEALLEGAGTSLRELGLIAVGLGPGSFTGLRVGLATAKGLALATGLPLRGVPSLHVLARRALEQAELALVVVDAGRGEVFGAAYRGLPGAPLVPALPPMRATPEVLAAAAAAHGLQSAAMCGAGARRYASIFAEALGGEVPLLAPEDDIPMGRFVASESLIELAHEGPSSVAALEPLYMRGSDAKLPDRPLTLD